MRITRSVHHGAEVGLHYLVNHSQGRRIIENGWHFLLLLHIVLGSRSSLLAQYDHPVDLKTVNTIGDEDVMWSDLALELCHTTDGAATLSDMRTDVTKRGRWSASHRWLLSDRAAWIQVMNLLRMVKHGLWAICRQLLFSERIMNQFNDALSLSEAVMMHFEFHGHNFSISSRRLVLERITLRDGQLVYLARWFSCVDPSQAMLGRDHDLAGSHRTCLIWVSYSLSRSLLLNLFEALRDHFVIRGFLRVEPNGTEIEVFLPGQRVARTVLFNIAWDLTQCVTDYFLDSVLDGTCLQNFLYRLHFLTIRAIDCFHEFLCWFLEIFWPTIHASTELLRYIAKVMLVL